MAGESQAAIEALHARGWTDSAIGRAVGRDSSLIHQIATGRKPGANLADALGALRDTGLPGPKSAKALPPVSIPEPPRRTRKSGLPASVRTSKEERAALPRAPREARSERGHGTHLRHARTLPNGQVVIEAHSKRAGRLAADIAESYPGTHNMRMAYKGADGKWHNVGTHGFSSDLWRDILKRAGSFQEAIADLLAALRYKGAAPTGEAEFYIVTRGVDKRGA